MFHPPTWNIEMTFFGLLTRFFAPATYKVTTTTAQFTSFNWFYNCRNCDQLHVKMSPACQPSWPMSYTDILLPLAFGTKYCSCLHEPSGALLQHIFATWCETQYLQSLFPSYAVDWSASWTALASFCALRVLPCRIIPPAICSKILIGRRHPFRCLKQRNRKRNLIMSIAPLKSQAHQDTSYSRALRRIKG